MVGTSSSAASMAATTSSAPSRSHVTGSSCVSPSCSTVGLDPLAADGGSRPAMHHALVGDQASYRPVGARRYGGLEPCTVGVCGERRHRCAQSGQVLGQRQRRRHGRTSR